MALAARLPVFSLAIGVRTGGKAARAPFFNQLLSGQKHLAFLFRQTDTVFPGRGVLHPWARFLFVKWFTYNKR